MQCAGKISLKNTSMTLLARACVCFFHTYCIYIFYVFEEGLRPPRQ